MAAQILPTLTDGTQFYTQRVVLDGVAFVLQFSWNARDSSWYLLIRDSSANPLLSRRLAVGSTLLGRFKIQGLPAGEIPLPIEAGACAASPRSYWLLPRPRQRR